MCPEEDEESFDLTLAGPGLKVDTKIDRVRALNVIKILMGDTAPPSPTPRGAQGFGNSSQDAPPLSLREYLDEVKAKTKVAQIVAIANFVAQFAGQTDISRDEIKAKFSEAAEPMPANFPRDFNKVLKAGWLSASHSDKSRFYVTQSGRAALAAGLDA